MRSNFRQISHFSFAVAVFMSAAVWSCGSAAADTVKLGVVGPFTGPAAFTGNTVRGAWDLAVKEANDAGGIKIDGRMKKLEIVAADSQSKPDIGVAAAQKLLVRDNVDVMVGDMLHSDVTLAMMEFAKPFNTKVFYVPVPTSSEISNRIARDPDKYGNVWKWDQDSDGYGTTTLEFTKYLQSTGIDAFADKTYAVVSEQTEYSQTVIQETRKRLDAEGWKFVGNESVPIGHSDFYPQLTKLRQSKPNLVVTIFTAANSGIAFVKQMKEQTLPTRHLALYYPSFTPFKQGVGEAGNGLLYAAVMLDPKRNPNHKAFAEKLNAVKVSPTTDALLGYCSAKVLIDALKRAGSAKADKLNPAMAATDNRECPNGIRLVFDSKRHSPILGPDHFFVSVGQIQNGEDVIVWPDREKTGEIVR